MSMLDMGFKKSFFLIALAVSVLACTPDEEKESAVKVESISIDQEDMSLAVDASVNLTAKVVPEDAAETTIFWSSSNEDLVLVSSSGKAKAISIGEAVITAKAGEASDFITITVVAKKIPVTGISLNMGSANIKVGESVTLVPTVTPDDATNKGVFWTSSKDDVATVDNGYVLGISPGSVTITATTEDGGRVAECIVTVKSNLAPSVTVGAEHISAISAVLMGKANLESSASADMTMGFQYSKSAGILSSNSVTIEATDPDSEYNYSVGITSLDPCTTYYYRSYVRQNGQDTYGETKSFTTKDLSFLLETKEAGDVDATKATMNAKLDLTDVQYKSLDYGFLWGSSEADLNTDVKCTEIDDNSISAALTNLSHKTQYWYKAYVKIDGQIFYGEIRSFTTDVVPVESVSIDKTEYTFNTIGGTHTLIATVLPADATYKSVEWTSDNEDVATVDQNGTVKAVGNGTATITVTTKDQKMTASCAIMVAQWITSISLDVSSLTLNEGQEQTLTSTVIPDNAADKSLKWTSLDESVATVDQTGKVTAVSKGTTSVKAEAKDGSHVVAYCDLSVAPLGSVNLGLSVHWATCNLCEDGFVNSPEIYGDYYAWGETSPYYIDQNPLIWKEGKTGYDWASYSFGNGLSSALTKYNNRSDCGVVDNMTEFMDYNYVDDAARTILGGEWRVPTYAEWKELYEKCTKTIVTNYKGTGINGQLITAANGNSIFLPEAGMRGDADLLGANTSGCYWSSSLYLYYPCFAEASFFGSVLRLGRNLYRSDGLSIRPVIER